MELDLLLQEKRTRPLNYHFQAILLSTVLIICFVGVKPEHHLKQGGIVCPWRSVNILDGIIYAWALYSDQIPADKDRCRKVDLCTYLGDRNKAWPV